MLYMALLTAFSFLRAEKKRKKEGVREPGRGTAGELAKDGGRSCRGSAAGGRRQGWRCAGGAGGGGWCVINQSI